MALPDEPFFELLVETFDSGRVSGRHGTLHVRAVEGQGWGTDLVVECNREMRALYPVGSRFIITAKLSDRKGGGQYLKSPPPRTYTAVDEDEAAAFLARLQPRRRRR